MKKNNLKHALLRGRLVKMMKAVWIIVLASVIQVSASTNETYSQTAKLDIQLRNVDLEKVLWTIKKQTEFNFFYNSDDVKDVKGLDISLNDATVVEILAKCLNGTDLTFEIVHKAVIIKKKDVFVEEESVIAEVPQIPQKEVRGKVTGVTGESIPGVTVVVKGTTMGTITDAKGNYVLTRIPEKATLQFSFVGMNPREVEVGDKTILNVLLEEEMVGIEEVVAVGYGTIKRSEVTGAITSIKGDLISKVPVSNVSSALAGTAKGVMVFDVDGDVGQDAIIKIRGESTIGDTNPLIVINGVPGGSLKDVPPDEVESIEVLKDAAAATIYGSRGANGVILITTKRGYVGKMVVSYDGYVKFNEVVNSLKTLDAYSQCFLLNEGQIMDGGMITPYESLDYEWLKNVRSNYTDLLRNTYTYRHKLSIAGGNEEHQFRISGTFDDDKGTFVNNYYKAGTFILASDHKLTDFFNLSTTITYKQDQKRVGYAYDTYKAVMVYAPYLTGFINGDPSLYSETQNSWKDLAYSRDDDTYRNNYTFNINPTLKIMKGLELSDRFAYMQNNTNREIFNYAQEVFTSTGQTDNTAAISYSKGSSFLNDLMLNLNRTLYEKHSILATVVFSLEKSKGSSLAGYRNGLVFQTVPSLNLGLAEGATNDSGYSDDTRVGIIGRVGYTYNKKYVVQASVRRDASSRFTPEKRWATFPSVSLAWNLDQEPFMKNISFISGAKLRASWGKLGRDKLDAYQYYSMVNLDYGYGFNNVQTTGATITGMSYEGAGWEANESKDIGLEFYCLKNKLYFTADYWQKNTVDMLFNQELPSYSGLRDNTISINGGEIMNKGLEFELNWKEKKGELTYSVGTNVSTYKNEVLSWPFGDGVERIYNLGDPRCFAVEVGHPYYSFYMIDAIGIWQSDAEIDAARYHQKNADGTFIYSNGSPVWGWPNYDKSRPSPGSLKFKDQNNDGTIDDNDRVHKGQRYPKVIIGLNASLEYKGFDLNIICQGNLGQSAYIYPGQGANSRMKGGSTDQAWAYARWTGDGSTNNTMQPRLSYDGTNIWFKEQKQPNDAHLHRADYFRIKSANIGYTFNQSVLKKVGLSSVRLYVSGFNLHTFTKYPGADPELGGNYSYDNYSGAGVDRILTYPVPRSYIFGTQITF